MKKIPDVLEHGVIYQINLRAFTPEGTLNAAAKMLPHLREIGADIVYLCPVVCADGSADVAGWSDRQRASGFLNPKNPYRIADNGCGIPEEQLGALFSGLAPGAGAADGRRRSAGIGLSVCATIVRAHGGAIRAENRREGGAVFRFALQTEGEMDAEV